MQIQPPQLFELLFMLCQPELLCHRDQLVSGMESANTKSCGFSQSAPRLAPAFLQP